MKRILIINSFYYPNIGGGAEIICQEQAEALANRGYHVAILTTTNKDGITQEQVNGLTVYRVHIHNLYWHFSRKKQNKWKRIIWHILDIYNPYMKREVKKILSIEKPDLVICHNLTGFSISIWDSIKASNLPIIQVLHDQYLQCPNSNAFKNNKACKKQCVTCYLMRIPHIKASRKVDTVVGVSQYVLTRLTKLGFFYGCKQLVIYNARQFENIPLKKEWDGQHPLRIGYIGTLSRAKGVEWLIRSFMELDINATLTIAGRGDSEEYERFIHNLAAKDNRIHFSGYVKSINHYKEIDLSVIPSLWPDTLPTVAFESCAYHVPVIATNIGGLPEIIQNNINGIIIDVKDPLSLKKSLITLYKSPYIINKMSANCRKAVEIFIDKNKNLTTWENVINNQ